MYEPHITQEPVGVLLRVISVGPSENSRPDQKVGSPVFLRPVPTRRFGDFQRKEPKLWRKVPTQ